MGAFKFCKSIFKSVFVTILACSREYLVMANRVLFHAQAADMGYLRRVHGVTLRDKVHNCEIREVLNVEARLLRIERSQL